MEAFVDYKEKAATVEPSTIRGYRKDAALISRYIGDVQLRNLGIAEVNGWMAQMTSEGYSPKTVTNPFRLLKQALKWAVAQDMLTKNPCDFCKPPKRSKTKINALNREERTRMLGLARQAPGQPLSMAIELALTTGMRRGEICALRWSDLNDDCTINVSHAFGLKEGGYYLKEPKTHSSARTIPLTKRTFGVLYAMRRDSMRILDSMGVRSADPFILGTQEPESRPYNPSLLGKEYAAFCKMNGFNCTFHDLRHTFASWPTRSIQLYSSPPASSPKSLAMGNRLLPLGQSVPAPPLPSQNGESPGRAKCGCHRGSRVSSSRAVARPLQRFRNLVWHVRRDGRAQDDDDPDELVRPQLPRAVEDVPQALPRDVRAPRELGDGHSPLVARLLELVDYVLGVVHFRFSPYQSPSICPMRRRIGASPPADHAKVTVSPLMCEKWNALGINWSVPGTPIPILGTPPGIVLIRYGSGMRAVGGRNVTTGTAGTLEFGAAVQGAVLRPPAHPDRRGGRARAPWHSLRQSDKCNYRRFRYSRCPRCGTCGMRDKP